MDARLSWQPGGYMRPGPGLDASVLQNGGTLVLTCACTDPTEWSPGVCGVGEQSHLDL